MPRKPGRPPKTCPACRPERNRERAKAWYQAAPRERIRAQHARSPEYRRDLGPCAVDGCTRGRGTARGLCPMHYDRWRRTGEVGPPEAKITRRNNRTPEGYVRRWIDGRSQLEHRWVIEQALGRHLWAYENVHHKNGRKDDNRLDNLEVWITAQPKGQRPEDLAAWVVEHYRELVEQALAGKEPHLL